MAIGDFAIFARDRIDMKMLGKAASVATLGCAVDHRPGGDRHGYRVRYRTAGHQAQAAGQLSVVTVPTVNSLGCI